MSLLSPQLLAFIKIVKHKTVHAAAAEIFLTQTAVTQRIRSLERSLKTTLFIRTKKGMVLTQEGEALLRYCNATIELEEEALSSIKGAGIESEIEIKISSPTSIMKSRVIPNCIELMSKYPNLLINYNSSDQENLHLELKSGNTDFAIITKDKLAQEMKFKNLSPEEYVLVCSSKWKNKKITDIIKNQRIIDFNEEDHITINYLKKYNLYDKAKSNRYFANRTDNLALLVSEGIGYTTLPKEFAMPYIKRNKLIILNNNKIYNIYPILAWYDRPESPQYFRDIINFIN